MTRKLDLLEVGVRSQAEEITQLKIKVELQRKQLIEASAQIKFLIQAQCSDDSVDRKCPLLNETEISEESVQPPDSEVLYYCTIYNLCHF